MNIQKLFVLTLISTTSSALFSADFRNPVSEYISRRLLTPDELAAIKKFNAVEELTPYLEDMLPIVQRPVLKPIEGSLRLELPDLVKGHATGELGVLDVTQAPFGADPTGQVDSTIAIQKAIDFARDAQMTCYFPAGDYLISDTIYCTQIPYLNPNGSIRAARNFPCYLMGESLDPDKRSRLILAANSSGFRDPENRKYVVHFKALPWTNPAHRPQSVHAALTDTSEQPNISYNHLFRDIDIVVGEGNRGAIGISMRGAEGTSIQSITIDATHGCIGMHGASGSGGSHHDITIIGGQIGIDTREMVLNAPLSLTGVKGATQPTATLSAITLLNQEKHAFIGNARGPIVGVGWKVESNGVGPLIRITRNPSDPVTGSFCLVDSSIAFDSFRAENVSLLSDRSFYLENVFVENAERVAGNVKGGEGWTKVVELSYSQENVEFRGHRVQEPYILDGVPLAKLPRSLEVGVPPADDLQSKHRWSQQWASWNSSAAVSIKAAPYLAVGDSVADDTDAIQKAIDENEVVLVPRGIYRISSTLRLKPNTKLIGVGQNYSVLITLDSQSASEAIPHLRPMIETANSADAETVISDIGLCMSYGFSEIPYEDKLWYYPLKWSCGQASLLRNLFLNISSDFTTSGESGGDKHLAKLQKLVEVTGQGAGKIHNLNVHGYHHRVTSLQDYRHLLIHDRMSEADLNFYHLHAQHASSPFQIEINRSSGINIFGLKTENETCTVLMKESSDVNLFGFGTLFRPIGGHYFEIHNSFDFKITNVADEPYFRPKNLKLGQFRVLKEIEPDGSEYLMSKLYRPIAYVRP